MWDPLEGSVETRPAASRRGGTFARKFRANASADVAGEGRARTLDGRGRAEPGVAALFFPPILEPASVRRSARAAPRQLLCLSACRHTAPTRHRSPLSSAGTTPPSPGG